MPDSDLPDRDLPDRDTPEDAPPDEDFGILLLLAYQGFTRALHEDLAAHGLSDLRHNDGYVFRALANGPRRIIDLANGLDVSKQAASQIVTDMESRGLVSRSPDPDDARAWHVQLTDLGERALRTARSFHARYESDLQARLGPRSGAALRAGLQSIIDAEIDPAERASLIRLP